MSVPIHNLYDYIYQVLEKRYFLYYFYPFGQKELFNLIAYVNTLSDDYKDNSKILYTQMNSFHFADENYITALKIFPKDIVDLSLICQFAQSIICHDQEPLDFEFYENFDFHQEYIKSVYQSSVHFHKKHISNLRWRDARANRKKWILLHSEINSNEVVKYQQSNKYECAYYWSHALLSRDWYRFAEHDKFLAPGSQVEKTFLIYCRATDGKRTYRKTFLQLLNNYSVIDYQLGSFQKSTITANCSAEYEYIDYNQTAISVVLETCFDSRIHLTEKTLRCIACGHPFILVGGPKSLQYIRTYGFKTFDHWIDESYDDETDSEKRLDKIVKEMQRIENLPLHKKQKLFAECNSIAEHNKKIFFSNNFLDQVVRELADNVQAANDLTADIFDANYIWQNRKFEKKDNRIAYNNKKRYYYLKFIKHLRKGGTIDDYEPPF